MPFTSVGKCPAFSVHFVVLSLTLLSFLLLMLSSIDAIRCFTGFKFVRGQKFGGDETECKDDNEFCYNVTAEAGVIFKASKAGCSYYRCLISRNKCINTEISGVPVSFCCCNTEDLCNGQ
ncbi:hypothetical protein niasHS_017759 [Heterodera schachtii]|uniref:Activin_recp domain-containing protein n=2 Tax=Heterodera TaxID=34509 RepID=A0ABD2I4K9_HETSC